MADTTAKRSGERRLNGRRSTDRRILQRGVHELGSGAIYVWQLPVRITHWLIVLSIIVLTVTGLYIHAPFLSAPTVMDGASMTATIPVHPRARGADVHAQLRRPLLLGFVGNSFASWRAIIPHNKAQVYWGREMAKYYLFIRQGTRAGHGDTNFLAGAAYTLVSILMVVQIATGLLLMSWVIGTGPIAVLLPVVGAFPGGIQGVRLLHYVLTFTFVAFAIHHVYSAILVDQEERGGVPLLDLLRLQEPQAGPDDRGAWGRRSPGSARETSRIDSGE